MQHATSDAHCCQPQYTHTAQSATSERAYSLLYASVFAMLLFDCHVLSASVYPSHATKYSVLFPFTRTSRMARGTYHSSSEASSEAAGTVGGGSAHESDGVGGSVRRAAWAKHDPRQNSTYYQKLLGASRWRTLPDCIVICVVGR